jgi:SH3-like domain-containing protein
MAAETAYDAAQTVTEGFAASVLKTTERLAAMYDARPVAINEKTKNMKTIKVQARVKLGTMEAARAAFSTDGVPVEVEVSVDEATAATIADKDAEIERLQTELAAKSEGENGAAEAEQKAADAEAKLAEAEQAHAAQVARVKAEYEGKLAEIKKPLATAVVADNSDIDPKPQPAAEDPNIKALKAALKGASPLKPKPAQTK